MGWHGRLTLDYRRDGARTVVFDRHEGPLRVLRALHPEGAGVLHHVLVHPPGGVVGGDVLDIEATLEPGSHALITTPGATRFYRSAGEPALQRAALRLESGARLEWLPLESIAYSGCIAENAVALTLAPGAETIGWDVLALGLPAAGAGFERGRYTQALQIPGAWRERGTIAADDRRLLDGPVGFAGRRVLATLWFAAGTPLDAARREALLDAARALAAAHPLATEAGATSPQPSVVVLRVLADRVEPAMALLRTVWSAWREAAWSLPPCPPRVWQT